MKIGTKSVLFGVHCFFIHPWLIAWGWWKAYGFRAVFIGRRLSREWIETSDGAGYPIDWWCSVSASLWSPRLWLAFIVHDIGYLGKPNMDGPEGETHPEVGAAIMRFVSGEPWGDFVLLHSRYYAKRLGRDLSPLCLADKWTIVLEPSWFYLPRARWSGELAEYLAVARERAAATDTMMTDDERRGMLTGDTRVWHRTVKAYMRRWIAEHADGREDRWTGLRHKYDVSHSSM